MIFGKPEQAPASGLDVGVGAQAQIGPMHVGVRVDLGHVRPVEGCAHPGLVSCMLVQLDDAGYRGGSLIGRRQLHREPIGGNERVGIGVRQPELVVRDTVKMGQHRLAADPPRGARRPYVALDDLSVRSESTPGTFCRPIRRMVRDQHRPATSGSCCSLTSATDAVDALDHGLFFVLSRHDDSNAPPPRPFHRRTQVSIR